MRGSDHRHRHGARFPDAQIRAAHRGAVVRAGEALGATLRGRRHALRRGARRLVLHHHLWQRRCGRPHAVRRRDCRLHCWRRGTQLRPPEADPVSHPAGLRADVAGAGAAWRLLLHRAGRAAGAVLRRPEGHQPQPACHFRQGADVELPRSGAGRTVRYGAQQHAARALHVPRRRTARGDESSFQRYDGSVGRSRAARRDRLRHHLGLRSCRIASLP